MDGSGAARGAAAFIERVLADLEAVAREHPDLALLAYLIETARAEALARTSEIP